VTEPTWRLRDATDDDVGAITGILNALLATTTIEYTDVPHTVASRRTWLADKRARGFPTVVAEIGGEVAGFATYGDFRDSVARPGYRFTVEHSVHVDRRWWGCGLGRVLMEELIERARSGGVHAMIGAIDAENVESLRFHERLGFVEVGRLPQVGHKFGRWLDLVLVERLLDG
jgi:phosphinothricin acetyltransferase